MQAAATGALKRHPTCEVRGRSREDPMPEGRRPRGVTPRPRSGAVAESTRLRRHRNGREELPRVRGQAGQARGDTQCPRSGAATRGVSYPASEVRGRGREEIPHDRGQGQWLGGPTPRPRSSGCAGRALRSYSTFKVRRGGGEEIPLVQGKEQWLRFAGAAVKRYPTPKVRETQVKQ